MTKGPKVPPPVEWGMAQMEKRAAPSSQSLTPAPDAHLEKLIDHYGDCCYHADDAVGLPSNGVAEARAAILEYLSERTLDTQRLDWLENKKAREVVYDSTQRQVIFRWPVADGIRAKIDSHRRASMKEPE